MNHAGQCLANVFSEHMSEIEVIRARNKLYNELLGIESATDAL